MSAVLDDSEIIEDIRDFHNETDSLSSSCYDREWDGRSLKAVRNHFQSWGNAIDIAGVSHNFVECPHRNCGNLYPSLGHHWRHNPPHRPEITDRQHEILTGLLMGDGSARKREGKLPELSCKMINEDFLKWIRDEFYPIITDIHFVNSAEENARKARESGFSPNAKKENYSDSYSVEIRHPDLSTYCDWYSTGRKRFPNDLELTPLILKVWYCCDGTLDQGRMSIGISNERDRKHLFVELFSDFDVDVRFKEENKTENVSLRFNKGDSKTLFKYIGEPLPDFEEKWPEENEYIDFRPHWTDEEIEILKEEYPENGKNIESLDRSDRAIKAKARRVGIPND